MSENYGYKWTSVGYDIYIITLQVFSEHETRLKLPLQNDTGYIVPECYSTDCIIKDIQRFHDGFLAQSIEGRAYFPFTYKLNSRIQNERIYYCKTLPELLNYQGEHIKNRLYAYAIREQLGAVPKREYDNSPFKAFFPILINKYPHRGYLTAPPPSQRIINKANRYKEIATLFGHP